MKWRLDDGQIEVVDDAMADVLRRKTPGQRIAMVGAAWRFARLWMDAAVRAEHAGWDESEVASEVRRRLSGGADRTARTRHGHP